MSKGNLKACTSEEVVYVTSGIGGLNARDPSCRAAVAQIARVGIAFEEEGRRFQARTSERFKIQRFSTTEIRKCGPLKQLLIFQ